jgi:hypothetical protein
VASGGCANAHGVLLVVVPLVAQEGQARDLVEVLVAADGAVDQLRQLNLREELGLARLVGEGERDPLLTLDVADGVLELAHIPDVVETVAGEVPVLNHDGAPWPDRVHLGAVIAVHGSSTVLHTLHCA